MFHDDDIEEAFALNQDVRGIYIEPIHCAFGHQTSEPGRSLGFVIDYRTSEVAGDGFLYDDEVRAKGGRWTNEQRKHFESAIARLFAAGMSSRAVKRALGISSATVAFYRKKYSNPPLCPCGALVTHQGWCRARFLASERRQEFMTRWHPTKRWPLVPIDGVAVAWRPSALEKQ